MGYERAKKQRVAEGEIALKLDTGHFVAVSVNEHWHQNGGGVHIMVKARWVDKNGDSHLCPNDQPIEAITSVNVGPDQIKQHGLEKLRREVLKMALGEEPEMVPVLVDPSVERPLSAMIHLKDGTLVDDPTFRHDPKATHAPLLNVHPHAKQCADIRHFIKTVEELRAPADPAALLGI